MRWSRIDGKWWEGRAVLSEGRRGRLRAEWNLWAHFCGVALRRNESGSWTLFLAFPPVALWLTLSVGWRPGTQREVQVWIHSWALWWNFWIDPDVWDSRTPRWRQGWWHPIDTLLGSTEYSKVDLQRHAIAIPMPEGCYPATATFQRCTWKRPRWFERTRLFTEVSIEARGGIPHEGKGESAYDCGIDGLCGYSVEGHDIDAAIADGVRRSLAYRQRRDGNRFAKYPRPGEASA